MQVSYLILSLKSFVRHFTKLLWYLNFFLPYWTTLTSNPRFATAWRHRSASPACRTSRSTARRTSASAASPRTTATIGPRRADPTTWPRRHGPRRLRAVRADGAGASPASLSRGSLRVAAVVDDGFSSCWENSAIICFPCFDSQERKVEARNGAIEDGPP